MSLPTTIDAIKPSELEGEPIPDHDGLPVTRTAAVIQKTGDGLSEAMGLASIHIPIGEHVLVLVVAKTVGHKYARAVEGTGASAEVLDEFVETLYLDAQSALILDPDLVGDIVMKHHERVAKARSDAAARKKAQKGEFQLPMPDGAEGAVDPDAAPGSHLSSVPDDGEDHADGFDPDAKAPWESEAKEPAKV